MKDIQNTKGDYKFPINQVGVNKIKHPLKIKTKTGEVVTTVGDFSMAVNLDKDLKGINMSRLPQLLSELAENEDLIFSGLRSSSYEILDKMAKKAETEDAYLDFAFDYFLEKEAPVSKHKALMPYRCQCKSTLEAGEYDFILSVEVAITALCPCSKEISDYSAHNQRGYVEVSIRYDDFIWLEELIELVEEVSSCEVYPILKRIDEKHVTEKAYDNPRFVEDIVRLIADKLNQDDRVKWFKVASEHQESIHPHNAYAVLEKWK